MANPKIGVDYVDSILHRRANGGIKEPDPVALKADLDFCKANGWNLLRLPYYWEGMIGNEENFFEELGLILEFSKQLDLKVIPCLFNWWTSSAWRSDWGGFPKDIVKGYNPGSNPDFDTNPEIRAFWQDLYTNKVRGVPNVWGKMSDAIEQVIEGCRPYLGQIFGFEILNEPYFWDDSNYTDIGVMNTTIAKELRKITWKPIVFDREIPIGEFKRKPSLTYLIRPKINNTIYSPHVYKPDTLDKQVENFKLALDKWKAEGQNVRLYIGEFGDQQVENAPTQANTEKFVKRWHDEGWAATYWAYNLNTPKKALRLATTDNKLTEVGQWYVDAIRKYYV